MKFKILGALIVAPIVVFGKFALAHEGIIWSETDLISVRPAECVFVDDTGALAVATGGRVFVKIDFDRGTSLGKCSITELDTEDIILSENPTKGFPCRVRIQGITAFLHPSDPDVTTSKSFHRGKAQLKCSGPYPSPE